MNTSWIEENLPPVVGALLVVIAAPFALVGAILMLCFVPTRILREKFGWFSVDGDTRGY